jgi:hypothetical protein
MSSSFLPLPPPSPPPPPSTLHSPFTLHPPPSSLKKTFRETEKLEDVLQKLAQVRSIEYEDQKTTLMDGTEIDVPNLTLGDVYNKYGTQEILFMETPKCT